MKIILASTNQGKIKEIKNLFKDYDVIIESLKDISYNEEIIENGNSFKENAYIKAKSLFDYTHEMTIADDSGIVCDGLNGMPGIYSARYSKTGNDEDNNKLLLENLKGVENRNARFVCAICAIYPNGDVCYYEGKIEGVIIDNPKGNNGFGYDPLFFVPSLNKTTAELSLEEKNTLSHRAKACIALKEDFLRRIPMINEKNNK